MSVRFNCFQLTAHLTDHTATSNMQTGCEAKSAWSELRLIFYI